MREIFAFCLFSTFAVAPAYAAEDVKTPLACKVGPASGKGFEMHIVNTTRAVLKVDAILNMHARLAKTDSGEVDDCFVLTAPLARGAMIGHVTKFDRDQDPLDCTAFISSLHPAVVHENGASEADCD